tara:strand:- start:159 stop:731 length:573 start_codon:yes stop_codon:yes gene_type:complete
MPALKNIAKAGVGGAGAAYRHYVDPDYTGDTAIHRGMAKVPEEAWYGSLAWGIMGDKNRKRIKNLAKKAGMKPKEYLSKKIPTSMKRSLMKNFGTPKKLAKKAATRLGMAATGVGAPAALGFLAKDIYDVGDDFLDFLKRSPETFKKSYEKHSRKKGGQIKKTKRKVHSKTRGKPRGVGKALRGYGAVSR